MFAAMMPLQLGGSESIISALVRGLEKHGGRLLLRAHVDQVVMEGGRAAGVRLAAPAARTSRDSGPPEVIRARKGVISNASVWDTQKLLPRGVAPPDWRQRSLTTPQVRPSCPGTLASNVHHRHTVRHTYRHMVEPCCKSRMNNCFFPLPYNSMCKNSVSAARWGLGVNIFVGHDAIMDSILEWHIAGQDHPWYFYDMTNPNTSPPYITTLRG